MSFFVYDGHGIWTLNILSQFTADGLPTRGCYFKRTPEADQKEATQESAASMARLEDIEALVSEIDSAKRSLMLHEEKYRGAMIYAAVDDTTVNLGSLLTRMTNAKNGYNEVYSEAIGGPIHGEGDHEVGPGDVFAKPGLTLESPPEDFDPADSDKSGDVSKKEQKQYNKEHPNG